MQRAEALARFAQARVARMATLRPEGGPHVVPVVFALVGDRVVTAVDAKPKATRRLQRIRNLEADPSVAFLVDSYTDDWEALWWVRVDGTASVDQRVSERWREALAAKYPQYRDDPPAGPVISARVEHVAWWEANPVT